MRVLILLGGHLSTSPRGRKEALALQEAGHEVRLCGIWHDDRLAAEDVAHASRLNLDFRAALDLRKPLARWRERLARARARCGQRWGGRVDPGSFGLGARSLLAAALRYPADLTIVHSEAGLWAGGELLRRGVRVGVDFEDWFSRDLPASDRARRPVRELAGLERTLLHQAAYRLCPSAVMARALAAVYAGVPPAVVRNTFPPEEKIDQARKGNGPLALSWFSQTIGPGRGLETLFAALPLVRNPVRVHLRGNLPAHYARWLEQRIPQRFRRSIIIEPWIAAEDLPADLARHDVGLALETTSIPSRNLTITNKFFQYLAAGNPVIATATAGQSEALTSAPGAGVLIPNGDASVLARAIDQLAGDSVAFTEARRVARLAAATVFSWEQDRAVLLAEANRALNSHHAPRLASGAPAAWMEPCPPRCASFPAAS